MNVCMHDVAHAKRPDMAHDTLDVLRTNRNSKYVVIQ